MQAEALPFCHLDTSSERPAGNAPAITEWHSALVTIRMGRVERVPGTAPGQQRLEGAPAAKPHPQYFELAEGVEPSDRPLQGGVVPGTDQRIGNMVASSEMG